MRLQQYLARAGVDSRRKCEDLIKQGRVAVNGAIVSEMGTTVEPGVDNVEFDGKQVSLPEATTVIMLNKPKGYLSAMSDERERTVASIVPVERFPGLYPIGRLDKETTGLLLFTTNGKLGHELLHPSMGVTKRYVALVKGSVTSEEAQQLSCGIKLDDGMTAPAECRVIEVLTPDEGISSNEEKNKYRGPMSLVEVKIHEGRKRQVRRMFDAISHEVIELSRTDFGPIVLGDLPEGCWRELSEDEIQSLNTLQSKRSNRK